MLAILISAFVTLFVVVDPVGMGPVFVGLTARMDTRARRHIGLEACVIAFGVLAGTALFGNWLLEKLGISLSAFRIAGGLLLFAIAFEMVFGRRVARKAETTPHGTASIAAFPLAIPLLAGPGAITAMLLLSGRMESNLAWLMLLIAIMGLIMALTFAVFLLSEKLEKLLGTQGEAVFGRLLGVLLAALAVQYVADGILGFVPR